MPPEYAGVIAIFCFSDEKSWGKWDAYLSEEDHVWGAVGIHPHQAVQFEAGVRSLIIEAMKHPRVVAWGECGLVSFHCFPLYFHTAIFYIICKYQNYSPSFLVLRKDYYRLLCTKEKQQACFTEQVQCAVSCQKPLVIHCRDEYGSTAATTDCYAILQKHMPTDWKVHFHCWSQSAAETEAALRMFPNAYFGFTGLVTTDRCGVTDAVGVVPMNRILLETDGPFCAPIINGKRFRSRIFHTFVSPGKKNWLFRRFGLSPVLSF